MANLMHPFTEREMQKMGVKEIRLLFRKLNDSYDKVLNSHYLLCPRCNSWISATEGYYMDKRYATDRFPICKKCLLKMVQQQEKDTDEPHETKESVQKTLQFMDKVYDDEYYSGCVKAVMDDVNEKMKYSAFGNYMTAIQSLPQFRNKTWKDSKFGDEVPGQSDEEINENSLLIKRAKKRFGRDYSTADLFFLETQYEDWTSRYECQTKAQEEIFERLAWKKLEIKNATREGQPTRDLDKTYQDLLNTANITPKQTGMDAFADAQTLGTLIQKWEETRPLPEIDPELEDVDKIGTYIDVFFRGHTSKMLGIQNKFSNIYEKFMARFTVKPPTYEDDEDSEALFNKVFGSVEDI